MKRLSTALILTILVAAPLRADNFSISLDGVYNRLFAQQEADSIGHWNAVGPSLQLQYHPVDSFSIGVDLTALVYWGIETPNPVIAQSANLALRYILNPGSDTTFYLMAMGGLNPQLELSDDLGTWGHDYHVTGGVGCWFFLGPTTAINFGAGYDLLGHDVLSLNNLQGRVGLTFFTSPAVKEKAAAPPPPSPKATDMAATPAESEMASPEYDEQGMRKAEAGMEIPAPPDGGSDMELSGAEDRKTEMKAEMDVTASDDVPEYDLEVSGAESRKAEMKSEMETSMTETKPDVSPAEKRDLRPMTPGERIQVGSGTEITSVRGDSLWDTAARAEAYGDPELYPLLVDANRKVLTGDGFVLPPGTKLTVPRDVTEDQKTQARQNAWKPSYTKFRGRGLTPEAYQRWRYFHGLASDWVEPDWNESKTLPHGDDVKQGQ